MSFGEKLLLTLLALAASKKLFINLGIVEPRHGTTILDARNAIPEVTSDEVRAIVELLQELHRENKLGPTAIIVGSELAFGMARVLAILTDDICAIRAFWNFDEAATWLQDSRAESKP